MKKKIFSHLGCLLAAVLMLCALPLSFVCAADDISTTGADNNTTESNDTTSAADDATYAVNGKGYKLSHASGKYPGIQNVKIQAKKGYKVYYSTSSPIALKNKISPKKTKSIKVKKNTTLYLIAVKTKQAVSQDWLNRSVRSYKKYNYKITNQIVFGDTKITTVNRSGLSISNNSSVATVDINKSGTYYLTGSGTNTRITVNRNGRNIKKVKLVLSGLSISNTEATGSDPILYIGENTGGVDIKLDGVSTFTGQSTFSSTPARAIIYNNSTGYVRFSQFGKTSGGTLAITDSISADTDFSSTLPTAGVYAAGKIAIKSGNITITTNGEGIYGKNTGVAVTGGELTVTSNKRQGLRTDSGNVNISGGKVTLTNTGMDGIYSASGFAKISGGEIRMTGIKGDGIEARNVAISGGDTAITTTYEYGATDFYDQGLGANRYNTYSSSTSNKITTVSEYINYNVGSHAGILAGREGFTYTVKGGDSGIQDAAGSLKISGGRITIDTTASGTMANNLTGTGYAAAQKGLYIIGAPSPGMKSYNTVLINGGVHSIAAGGSGIVADGPMEIVKDSDITITQAYRGLESPDISIGTENVYNDTTQVKMYTAGTGIYGYSEARSYEFEDDTYDKYRRVSVGNKDNRVTINSGYVNVMIDSGKTINGKGAGVLPSTSATGTAAGGTGAVSFKPDGNGIYSSGDITILGGDTVIYGPDQGSYGLFNYLGKFRIGSSAEILAMGQKGSGNTLPSSSQQPYLEGVIPAPPTAGGAGGAATTTTTTYTPNLKANDTIGIMRNTTTTIVGIKLPKDANYLFYSSSDMRTGSHDIYVGGDLSTAVNTYTYDGRFTTYTEKATGAAGAAGAAGGAAATGPVPRTTLSAKKK